jgi:hypothetical protein
MAKRMTGSTFIKFAVPLVLAWSSVLLRADMEATFDTTAVARVPWGGEHFILRVSKKGAEAEFDCARGKLRTSSRSISMAISMSEALLRQSGNFHAPPRLTPESKEMPLRFGKDVPPLCCAFRSRMLIDVRTHVLKFIP